jgi:cob(I)alamin adenosyltransferase
MKIYTRRGDSGHTGIWGGARFPKDDLRIEAIGSGDEGNAAIGAAIAGGVPDLTGNDLAIVPNNLFVVGSDLIAPDRTGTERLCPESAARTWPGWKSRSTTSRPRSRSCGTSYCPAVRGPALTFI